MSEKQNSEDPTKVVIGEHAAYFDTGMWTFVKGVLVAPEDLTIRQLRDHLTASGGAVYLREDGRLVWLNITRWNRGAGEEMPFKTYERITGEKWPGGKSEKVATLLERFGITWPAGSAEANLCLQGALLAIRGEEHNGNADS